MVYLHGKRVLLASVHKVHVAVLETVNKSVPWCVKLNKHLENGSIFRKRKVIFYPLGLMMFSL